MTKPKHRSALMNDRIQLPPNSDVDRMQEEDHALDLNSFFETRLVFFTQHRRNFIQNEGVVNRGRRFVLLAISYVTHRTPENFA